MVCNNKNWPTIRITNTILYSMLFPSLGISLPYPLTTVSVLASFSMLGLRILLFRQPIFFSDVHSLSDRMVSRSEVCIPIYYLFFYLCALHIILWFLIKYFMSALRVVFFSGLILNSVCSVNP